MTDTHSFYTVALNRKTGERRSFFGLNHHLRAVEWLKGFRNV